MKKNLVLTGMMGVGKSTIGNKLAEKLNLKFKDIDKIIEKKEKKKIKDIFDQHGESYFRKVERKITIDELKQNNSVISLGGGAFLNAAIRKEIENTSISFWLDLDPSSLLSRIKRINIKKRPLLEKNNLENTINQMYSERKKIYNRSDYRIKCKSLKINEILEKIEKLYKNANH